jgi:hypothetical protein
MEHMMDFQFNREGLVDLMTIARQAWILQSTLETGPIDICCIKPLEIHARPLNFDHQQQVI